MHKKIKLIIAIVFIGSLVGLMWSFRYFVLQTDTVAPLELLPQKKWELLYNDTRVLGVGQYEYKQRCYKCHGLYGEGSYKGVSLIDDKWDHGSSENAILKSTYYGVGTMRGYGKKLLPKDLHAITVYVKYLSQVAKDKEMN